MRQWDRRLESLTPKAARRRGESRPPASPGLVKDVTVSPQGPAQLVASAALMFWGTAGWLLNFFSQAHTHAGNYTSEGAVRVV